MSKLAINSTIGSSLGLSTVAAAVGICCVGPGSVVLFGVTGAVTLAGWTPYRPIFLGISLVMLVFAYWLVYFRKPVCEDGTCNPSNSIRLKLMLHFSTFIVVLALFIDDLFLLAFDSTPFLN